jgi:hypothetical protein
MPISATWPMSLSCARIRLKNNCAGLIDLCKNFKEPAVVFLVNFDLEK